MNLDIGIPPRRLGRALRAARRAERLSRKTAAASLGISPRLLAAWERGARRVPTSMTHPLTTLYGEHLTALVPTREPVRIDVGRMVVGEEIRIMASTARDDVLASYVELLTAVRGAKPGEALALRTGDLETLAASLGRDVDDIEARIVALLDCTRAEAATLHAEMRRRMLVPAAGFAIGAAAMVSAITLAPSSATRTPHQRPLAQTEAVAAHTTAPTTTAAGPGRTTPTTHAPATTTTAEAPAPSTTATTTATTPPTTTAPTIPTTTATTPATSPPPETSPATRSAVDDPPVSIPPGETATIVQP